MKEKNRRQQYSYYMIMMYILFNYMYNDFIVNALKYFYIYLQYYFFIFFFLYCRSIYVMYDILVGI